GDQVEPGSPVGQVVDAATLELATKVGELDRSNIRVGQTVDVELDSLPGQTYQGTVKTVGGMSTRMFWDDNAGGQFEVSIQFANPDPRWRPGLSAHVVIVGDQRKNALYVPRQALFSKETKRIVYVKNGGGYESKEVKVQNENETRAVVEGLTEGTEVALADPTAPRKAASSVSASPGGTP